MRTFRNLLHARETRQNTSEAVCLMFLHRRALFMVLNSTIQHRFPAAAI